MIGNSMAAMLLLFCFEEGRTGFEIRIMHEARSKSKPLIQALLLLALYTQNYLFSVYCERNCILRKEMLTLIIF